MIKLDGLREVNVKPGKRQISRWKMAFKIGLIGILQITFLLGAADITNKSKQRLVISGEEGAPLFKNIVSMGIAKDSLFLVDNFGNQILHYSLSPNVHFVQSIGRKGQGPGDIYLPGSLFCSSDQLIVKDNFSFSFFDLTGHFTGKFSHPKAITSFCVHEGKTYCLEIKANDQHLINVYDKKGALINSFGQKFQSFPNMKLKYISPDFVESCIFDGKLLCDKEHIYYISQRYGKLLRFTYKGQKVMAKDLIRHFGKAGQQVVAANQKTFSEVKFDVPSGPDRGVPHLILFEDAVLQDKLIYLASTSAQNKPNIPANQILTVRIFQTGTLNLFSTHNYPLSPNSRLQGIAIRQTQTDKDIFLNLRTPDGSQIETLTLSN